MGGVTKLRLQGYHSKVCIGGTSDILLGGTSLLQVFVCTIKIQGLSKKDLLCYIYISLLPRQATKA